MLKRLLPLSILAVLTGCTTTQVEELHRNTVDTIHQSETNISSKIDLLTSQIVTQQTQIDDLSQQISQLEQKIAKSNKDTNVKVAAVVKPAPTAKKQKSPAILNKPAVLGGVEKVKINAVEGEFNARVDTGAATSSLNAIDIQEFERNGSDWVRFHLADDNQDTKADSDKEKPWIEAPVLRYVKIRQSTSEKSERRPVIELWIHVGELHEKAQFTLADRTQMSHPILLGREFLQDIAVVDVSKKYLQSK